MRIFFSTPHQGKSQYQPFVDEVLAILKKRKVNIISPEDGPHYEASIKKFDSEGPKAERAHYGFVTHGIAEADVVIIEASYDDFRVGHEVTLALLYGKPTLVLSQHTDYAKYLSHELLVGAKYETKRDLRQIIQRFVDKVALHQSQLKESTQVIGGAADALHMAALAEARHQALRDESEFGTWARQAEENPDKAYTSIQKTLGHLPVNEPWEVFAPVYNEDTPDYVFTGVARFVQSVFSEHAITHADPIADAATHTGALARNLAELGYRDITTFDASRKMLSEAFRLNANIKCIKMVETELNDINLPRSVKGMTWVDYSSNFALTPATLKNWLENLLSNIAAGGCLVFDIRTVTGWQVNFFQQKVTTFATDRFQRIWINLPDYEKKRITFDIFIRTRRPNGSWGEWNREQMTERMWSLAEVKKITSTLTNGYVEDIYGDDFSKVQDKDSEPGLAYIVIKRR